VTPADARALELDQEDIRKEVLYFFTKFESLDFYYKLIDQQFGGGIAPSQYSYKLAPIDGSALNRVFEVEEHMGQMFLEGIAEMHHNHKQMQRN
jgi:hypothetical protein